MGDKVRTYIVGVSGVATASLLVVAESIEQAEEAVAVWLEKHNPEDQRGTTPSLDEWDVEIGSTDVWRDKIMPEAIMAADVLAVDADDHV